jgi:H+-transporting ATPase
MTDFVKIALSTDDLKWSQKPNTWNITGIVKVSLLLNTLIVIESFGLLYVGLNVFHLSAADETLYTFSFEILFYFAMFLIFNVRERGHFWESRPSKTLLTAMILSMIATTIVTTTGIPGLKPLPIAETLFVVFCTATFSLTINDLAKSLFAKRTETGW